jgi:hypothetical protein
MANLLSTTVNGNVLVGPSGTANAYDGAATGKLYFGNQVSDSPTNYHITTNMEDFGGNYSKLDIRWYTGQRFYAHYAYGGFRFKEITTGNDLFSIGEGDVHVRVENNLYIAGNLAIHAGNIGSQSVSVARQLLSPNDATVVAADSAMPSAGHSFIHTLALGPGGNDGHILGMSWGGTTSIYGAQIFLDTDPTDTMAIRSRSNAGVWTSWKTVWHSGNLTNLNQLTNGPGYITSGDTTTGIFTTFLGNGTSNIGSGYTRVIRNENGLGGNPNYAPILHIAASDTMWQIAGPHAGQTNLVWRSGYSGAWDTPWWTILHTGNYTSFAPSLTGTGASGTWGISITGNANTATTAGDSTNLGGLSSSRYLYYRGYSTSGNFQTLQSTESIIRFDQVGAIDGWSNAPGGVYTYGGVLSLRGNSFGLQIYGSHTGDLVFKTQWDNDQYSGWRNIIHSSNIGSQSVSYATSAGSAGSSTTAANANHLNTTRDTPSDSLQYWQASGLGIDEAPSGDWHNTIRMGHGSPLSYYSNTLAIRMTGSGVGDIYTQTIMNGVKQGWKKHWNDSNLTNLNQLTNGPGYITGYSETDTLATVTGRGATTASQVSFTKTDDHAISVGTIRGRAVGSQTGEFIQLYERVNIGGPNGWGAANTAAPSYGLSVYGGANIGYGNNASLFAYAYRGNGNVGGTGEASWHPAGIYSGGTQWLYGTTYRNNASTSGQGQMYFDGNYGYGMVGLYASTRYQAIFAMGDAYKLPADGTTTGSLYGLAWSHPNAGGVAANLNTHGLLVMENGTFLAAISGSIRSRDDMRAPIFYDSANTEYYGDFAGISSMYGVAIRGDQSSTDTSNQIFFWSTGNTTTSAIGFKANGGYFTNPTGAGDGYNTYFTMDSPGRGWVFREGRGGADFGAAYTSGWILNNGVWQANASMRAPIFYDSQDTNYYVDPNSTSKLVQVNLGTVNTRLISDAGVGYLKIYGSASNYLGVGPYDNNGWVYFENSGNSTGIYFNTPGRYAFDSVDVTPYTDNENSLGNGSYRWANIYTGGWLRNYGAQGIYNESYGTHFYSNGGASWAITGSGGNVQLEFRSNHQSTIRGYVYADTSNQIGFLNNGGGWSFRTNSSLNAFVHGPELTINADGASYSNIIMNDGDEGARTIHCNSNRVGFLTQGGSWGSWCNDNGSWENATAMYSPIFYDSADNSYYGDFAGFSRMSEIGVTNNYVYNYDSVESSRSVAEFGNVGKYVATRNAVGDYPSFSFEHVYGSHSWGQIARFHIRAASADRPSIQFSSGSSNDRWNIGFCTGTDNNFRISQNMGYRPDNSGTTDGWGTARLIMNTSGVVDVPQGYISNGNPWSTANSAFFPNGITTAGGTNWIYGTTTFIGNAPGNGAGHDFSSSGHQYSTGSITTPLFLVNNHSDNTRGYRIHNTSSASVSAMFVNSSNQLVIAAGAVDQINLNKKVYVNAVALGVNIAPSATAGRIDASNDIVAYSSSDERLKENITPISNALDKVKTLTGVEFDWRMETKDYHGYVGHDVGVIAQQVKAVLPEAVRTNANGYLAVRYEKLIGLLIEANKELAARVEELEKKIG